eukprot:CAMPEP_0172788118 /NCGR_PEP_ID=MMETSP1074-20121228/206792_1 /TAXON_ID=2916 /ORGANISM="Ceratium fusus, Strain PA161109" /LENGTH=102 /DNA_ID=CAMNT_0013625139 /DNA_START=991 /DNA_END=1297 /DNA_ORIENTATION=-
MFAMRDEELRGLRGGGGAAVPKALAMNDDEPLAPCRVPAPWARDLENSDEEVLVERLSPADPWKENQTQPRDKLQANVVFQGSTTKEIMAARHAVDYAKAVL